IEHVAQEQRLAPPRQRIRHPGEEEQQGQGVEERETLHPWASVEGSAPARGPATRVALAMETGEDDGALWLRHVEDRVGEAAQQRPAHVATDYRVPVGRLLHRRKR